MKKKILTLTTIEYTDKENNTTVIDRLVLAEVDDNTTQEVLFGDVKSKAMAWATKNIEGAQHIAITVHETIS